MATHNNLHVPDDLLAELNTKAQAEGKTVDELAEAALRQGLEERGWQDLLEYGRQKGRESGYTEGDVPRVVKEWRQEQKRGR
jgi:flagellar biosynthesis/type III secretory pathway protein FliH